MHQAAGAGWAWGRSGAAVEGGHHLVPVFGAAAVAAAAPVVGRTAVLDFAAATAADGSSWGRSKEPRNDSARSGAAVAGWTGAGPVPADTARRSTAPGAARAASVGLAQVAPSAAVGEDGSALVAVSGAPGAGPASAAAAASGIPSDEEEGAPGSGSAQSRGRAERRSAAPVRSLASEGQGSPSAGRSAHSRGSLGAERFHFRRHPAVRAVAAC